MSVLVTRSCRSLGAGNTGGFFIYKSIDIGKKYVNYLLFTLHYVNYVL
nr:MAG TPA: hypothetical protein [Caudoviricetes sp.]DAI04676.1 MAG TPA: hypothetical protein [Caudoviricetes sp.]